MLGLVLLAIGLYRAKVSPAWVAAGLAAGAVLNVAGFVIGNTAVIDVSCVALLLSLGGLVVSSLAPRNKNGSVRGPQLTSSTAREDALHHARSSS